jgi:hypothetical protein
MEHNIDATVKLDGGNWKIEGKPHVIFRAEKALLNSRRTKDAVFIPATPEAAYEILWFSQRFTFEFGSPLKLRGDAARYMDSQSKAKQILDNGFASQSAASFRAGKAPRRYQVQAAELWKAKGSLLLADDLGTGKTLSASTAFSDPALLPVAIVVPTHLARQWKSVLVEFFKDFRAHEIRITKDYQIPKFRRCASCETWHEQRMSSNGSVASSGACPNCRLRLDGVAADPNVFIVSYSKLASWAERLAKLCKSVVFDEVDELRRWDSQKCVAARSLSAQVRYRIGMSATPCRNLGGEMFNIMEAISPGALGTKEQFRETWCKFDYGTSGKEPALKDPNAFGEYLRSEHLMLRRTREEVGRELPAHQRIIHPIDTDLDKIKEMHGKAAQLAKLILNKSVSKGDVMNATGQLESLIRQETGIAKSAAVCAFVDLILQTDTPVLLAGWHRAVYAIWMERLKDHKPVLYTGTESPSQKAASKNAFVTGKTNLMIISHASGAGLDGLQHRCTTGVMGELAWTNAQHLQLEGRYHRDGQQKPCITHYLVSEYGLDPIMSQVIAEKKEQSSGILHMGATNDSVVDFRESIRKLAEGLVLGQHKNYHENAS